VCLLENGDSFAGQINLPFGCRYVQNTERSAGAKPAFAHFIQVSQAMNHVPLGVLFWQVEKMDGAGSVRHINHNIADLFETIRAFIHAEVFRDTGSGLRTQLTGRNMVRERRVRFGVFQERSVQVNE
jgi:hypothetical protein